MKLRVIPWNNSTTKSQTEELTVVVNQAMFFNKNGRVRDDLITLIIEKMVESGQITLMDVQIALDLDADLEIYDG